jgi:hypothetical protein
MLALIFILHEHLSHNTVSQTHVNRIHPLLLYLRCWIQFHFYREKIIDFHPIEFNKIVGIWNWQQEAFANYAFFSPLIIALQLCVCLKKQQQLIIDTHSCEHHSFACLRSLKYNFTFQLSPKTLNEWKNSSFFLKCNKIKISIWGFFIQIGYFSMSISTFKMNEKEIVG